MVKDRTIVVRSTDNDKIKVLGLDASSSTIGWGVVSYDGYNIQLSAYGHIKPLNSKYDLIERLSYVYNKIYDLCKEFLPTNIAVEEIIMFMKGQSQAKTITILSAFNRVTALAAYHATNKNKISFIPVLTIRKIIKNNIKSKVMKKEEIPEIIKKYLYCDFKPVINRDGNIAIETNDEADGIAVAWAEVFNAVKILKNTN